MRLTPEQEQNLIALERENHRVERALPEVRQRHAQELDELKQKLHNHLQVAVQTKTPLRKVQEALQIKDFATAKKLYERFGYTGRR